MFSFRTTPLDRQEDVVLRKGRLAVLCNQSAWNPETEEYLFDGLYRRGSLKTEEDILSGSRYFRRIRCGLSCRSRQVFRTWT